MRFVVTSLTIRRSKVLYEKIYCARGQAENHIKARKCHLASDRTSCSKANANQMQLILHHCAYWLLWKLKSACPKRSSWRRGCRPVARPCRMLTKTARSDRYTAPTHAGRGRSVRTRSPERASQIRSRWHPCASQEAWPSERPMPKIRQMFSVTVDGYSDIAQRHRSATLKLEATSHSAKHLSQHKKKLIYGLRKAPSKPSSSFRGSMSRIFTSNVAPQTNLHRKSSRPLPTGDHAAG